MTLFTASLVLALMTLTCVFALSRHRTEEKEAQAGEAGNVGETAFQKVAESHALRQGLRAFMRSDYTRARPLLEQAAEQEQVKAQICLARMYFAGNGVERNHELYVYWLQRAAGNGDKPSKAKLKKLGETGVKNGS